MSLEAAGKNINHPGKLKELKTDNFSFVKKISII
jgi:hypothetical protein